MFPDLTDLIEPAEAGTLNTLLCVLS